MARIEIEQKPVTERQAAVRRALGGEGQHCVSVAGMMIHQEICRFKRTRAAAPAEGQSPERVGFDLPRLSAQLAPGDRAVLIGVEPDRDVEIAQRDVPLPANTAVRTDIDLQIAVGSQVSPRWARRDQRERQDDAAQHYTWPGWAAKDKASTIRPIAAIQLAPARRAIRPQSVSRRRAASKP